MRPTTEPRNISQGWNAASHRGTDWSMGIGGGLQAVLDGTVVDYTRNDGAEVNRPLRGHMTNSQHWSPGRGGIDDIGNCLVLRHANGIHTVYLHVSPYNVSALRGRTFKKGERLPVTSGHNGWSTGPHLHFEVFRNGTRINPIPFLNNISPPSSGGGSNVTLTNRTDLNNLYRDVLGRSRGSGEGEDVYLNKDYRWVHRDIRNSNEAKRYRDRIAGQASEIAKLKKDIAQATESLSKANNELKTASDRLNDKQTEIDGLSDEVANLERVSKELTQEIVERDEKIDQLQKELREDKADVEVGQNLNAFGVFLKRLITLFGLKDS